MFDILVLLSVCVKLYWGWNRPRCNVLTRNQRNCGHAWTRPSCLLRWQVMRSGPHCPAGVFILHFEELFDVPWSPPHAAVTALQKWTSLSGWNICSGFEGVTPDVWRSRSRISILNTHHIIEWTVRGEWWEVCVWCSQTGSAWVWWDVPNNAIQTKYLGFQYIRVSCIFSQRICIFEWQEWGHPRIGIGTEQRPISTLQVCSDGFLEVKELS